MYDDIIFKGEKVVIPFSMVTTILNSVHLGHRGAEACKRRAREVVYWPTMTKDICTQNVTKSVRKQNISSYDFHNLYCF